MATADGAAMPIDCRFVRLPRIILATSSVILALLVACSPAEPDLPAADGGQSTDATSSVVDAGSTAEPEEDAAVPRCNSLDTRNVPKGIIRGVTSAPPAARGGTIENGTYVHVETIAHGVALPETEDGASLLRIEGSTVQGVSNPDVLVDRTDTQSWAISGNTIAITRSCPSAKSTELTFTAEDVNGTKELTLFATDRGIPFSSRFRRTN